MEWILANQNGPDSLAGYILHTMAIMAAYNSRPHRSHSKLSTHHKAIISSNYYSIEASFQVTLSHVGKTFGATVTDIYYPGYRCVTVASYRL
jgi:hypothetical protein